MNHKIEISAETLRRWRDLFASAGGSDLFHSEKQECADAMREIDALLDGQAWEECCDPPKRRPELFVHHEGDPVIPRLEGGFDIYHVTACAADAAIQKRLIELGWTPPPVRVADNETGGE